MFKFQYIDKIPTKPSAKLFFGNLLHRTLKFILDDLYNLPSKTEITKFYSENFDKTPFASEEEAQNYFSAGLQILENFSRQIKIQIPQTVVLEDKFVIPIGKHLLSGIVDRIDKITDDHFEVIDYKTGRLPRQGQIHRDLQLTAYYYATKTRWPHLKNIKLSLYYLGPNIKLSTQRDERHIDQLSETIHKTAENIDQHKFEPTQGPLCNWCDFAPLCPIMKEKYRTSEHQIDQVLAKFLELKTIEDEIKDEQERLKPFIHQYLDQEKVEKLFSDLGTISRQKRSLYQYDPEVVRQILTPSGHWLDVAKVDSARLHKILDGLNLSKKDQQKIFKTRKLLREQKNLIAQLKRRTK